MSSFVDRMIGSARLDPATFEEVEGDRTATGQAMAVVLLSNLAAGSLGLSFGLRGAVVSAVLSLAGWYLWAFTTYIVGTRILPEPQTRADQGELLRTLGFSSSPGLLRVFGFIPVLGRLLDFVVMLWMLVAMVVAVRQALDYKSSFRAVAVCLIGFIVYVVVASLLFPLFVSLR